MKAVWKARGEAFVLEVDGWDLGTFYVSHGRNTELNRAEIESVLRSGCEIKKGE